MRVKKLIEKTDYFMFLLATLILFLSILLFFFIYLQKYFSYNLLTKISLIVIYLIIFFVFSSLYIKIIKLTLKKPILKKEFDALIKKKDKRVFQQGISFNNWLLFFLFSIYYGLYLFHPLWAIKQSARDVPRILKKLLTFNTKKNYYAWYKIKDKNKEKYIIESYVKI